MTLPRHHIISAKGNVPSPRRNYIPRKDLQRRLDRLAAHKVTVVKGAPGSGKTTLLAAYFDERPSLPVRWVSLDANDNSMRPLWSYVLEALKTDIGPRAAAWQELISTTLQADDVDAVLVELINALQPAEDVFLVLDDGHYLTDPRVVASLQFFLRYSSDKVHLVLSTRDESTPYLSEWRMAGQLLEIDNDDLKVSEAEARQFLNKTLHLRLDEALVDRVIDLAEGWIGGLQLLGVALERKGEPAQSVTALGRPVVEYLSGEILDSLSDGEQNFLLATSVLRYLDEAVCRAVSGKDDAGARLQQLLERNLFVVTVNEVEGVYRYHPLFQEFLQRQLLRWPASARRDVHRRAAEYYRRLDDAEESVHHYLAAQQFEEALDVIRGVPGGVMGWRLLQRMPLSALEGQTEFIFQRLISHMAEQQFDLSAEIIQHFRGRLDDPLANRLFHLLAAVIDHDAYEFDAEPWSTVELHQLPLSNETKAILYSLLAVVLVFMDREGEAMACLEETDRVIARVENPYIRYYALQFKGQVKEQMGYLRECEKIFDDMFHHAKQYPFLGPILASAYISVVGILLKMGRLDEARVYLDKAKERAARNPAVEVAYLYNELEFYILQGDKQAAASVAQRLLARDILSSSLYCAPMLRYLLLLDMADEAMLARFHFDQMATPHWQDYLLHARLLGRTGQRKEALVLIDERLGRLRQHQARLPLVDTLLAKAEMLAADPKRDDGSAGDDENVGDDRERAARNALREAVHYSWEEHLQAPILMVSEPVRVLLKGLRNDAQAELQDGEKDFLDAVIARWAAQDDFATDGSQIFTGTRTGLGDLLSERETEVLLVLAEGATNKQIAQRLHISVATVKTHVVNIYSKLHVSNRVEAVETARRHGILQEHP